MVHICIIKCCKKHGTSGFYNFPRDPGVFAKWVEKVSLSGVSASEVKKHSRVCGKHFVSSDFVKVRLKDCAIPSQFLTANTVSKITF